MTLAGTGPACSLLGNRCRKDKEIQYNLVSVDSKIHFLNFSFMFPQPSTLNRPTFVLELIFLDNVWKNIILLAVLWWNFSSSSVRVHSRSCYRPQSSDRGRAVPGALPGQHPAGVRGPTHQGHQDDAGRGGGLQDKGERKQISLLTLGIQWGNFDLIATFRDALQGTFYPGILTSSFADGARGLFCFWVFCNLWSKFLHSVAIWEK